MLEKGFFEYLSWPMAGSEVVTFRSKNLCSYLNTSKLSKWQDEDGLPIFPGTSNNEFLI